MSKINQNIDIENCKKKLVETGAVFIRDFLNVDYANQLENFFTEKMPNDWWFAANRTSDDVEYDRNYEHNNDIILNKRRLATQRMYDGNFSYSFLRTFKNHHEGCVCEECNLRKWLESSEILDFLSKIGDGNFIRANELFVSKYSEGCFLSPHTDEKKGDIGFVLQLTKNWKPEWGGLLHFMSDDKDKITSTETPTFNTLTLFYLPEQSGKWHYVSHVNPHVKSSRIAYTGWFCKE